MIADLDRTIRELLKEELVAVREGQVEVAFDQPKREWSGRINKPTINFFLYDLRENAQLRQNQLERSEPPRNGPSNGNGTSNGAQPGQVYQKRTPMRVDCFYMVTAWAKDPLDEHRLLTNCVMALYKYGVMLERWLQGRLQNPKFPVRARVASHDVLTNPAEVWSALDNEMRPTVSYVITLALDPWQVFATPEVQMIELRVGESRLVKDTGLPDEPAQLARIEQHESLITIGGQVYDALNHNQPVAGVEVQVKDTGLFTRSDAQGRFRFANLWLTEDFTLTVYLADKRLAEKKVKLPPGQKGEYRVDIAIAPSTSKDAKPVETKTPKAIATEVSPAEAKLTEAKPKETKRKGTK